MLTEQEQRVVGLLAEAIESSYGPQTLNFNQVFRLVGALHERLANRGGLVAEPATESAQLFTQVGRVLFGERWKSDMATALGDIGVSTVDDWGKGRRSLPQRVWLEVAALLQDRWQRYPGLLASVHAAASED